MHSRRVGTCELAAAGQKYPRPRNIWKMDMRGKDAQRGNRCVVESWCLQVYMYTSNIPIQAVASQALYFQ